MSQQATNMANSIGLIRRRFHLAASDNARHAMSQMDLLANLAREVIGADLAALFYRPAGSSEALLMAVRSENETTNADLARLEKAHRRRHCVPDTERLQRIDQGGRDDFGTASGYAWRYQQTHDTDDGATLTVVAYITGSASAVPHTVDSQVSSICHLAAESVSQLRQHRGAKEFALRLAELLGIFDLPVTEIKYRQLLSRIVGSVIQIQPLDGACLLSRKPSSGTLSVLEFSSGRAQQSNFTADLEKLLEDCWPDECDDDKGRMADLSAEGWAGFTGLLAHELRPSADESLILVVWTDRPGGFHESDRELVRLYCFMATTLLRHAAAIREALLMERRAQQSSTRLADNEALAALTDMTSGVAHDINNIIGGILGRIELLKMQTENPKLASSLDKVEALAMEGAETVRRIQEFATSARYRKLEPIDLCELVGDIVSSDDASWRQMADVRRVQVVIRAEPGAAVIDGSEENLRALLAQLIRNAIEHSPEDDLVTINIANERQGYRLTVADHGPGVPENLRRKIFYPFFTTKKAQRGAGLGLSIVHGIAVRHGGSVVLETEVGKGTTIGVTLPRPTSKTEDSDITRRLRLSGKPAVLVVDDDAGIREILSDMLTISGYEVETRGDGFAALEAMKSRDFDLIITDLGMPGMSGLELASNVHETNPKLPIAMITGWGIQLNDDEIQQKGIKSITPKPFRISEIERVVNELLPRDPRAKRPSGSAETSCQS